MSRFVIIDDTNPSIQYSGPWFEAANNTLLQISQDAGGPPFQNTLHGVNVSASLSFNFSGSAVIVYGTSITTKNAAGTQLNDPIWECFIDNISIVPSPPSSVVLDGNQSNWILCGAGPSQIQDGPHLLTVNASVSKQTFWFDQIQYAPSASVSLNQSLVRIDTSDSAIQYSPGSWEFVDNPINYTSSDVLVNFSSTQTNGASFTYEFSGTSIALYGSAAADPSIYNASYTIDGQVPINFSVGNASLGAANILSNAIFFQTEELSLGQHTLVVTYLGNNNTQRGFFSYFVQQDGPSSTSSNTPTPSNTSTVVPLGSTVTLTPTSIGVASGDSSGSSPGKPTEASIIGGVIGGLVLVSLLIAIFLFLCRRNKQESVPTSDVTVVNPFAIPPLNPKSTFLPQNYTSNDQSLLSQSISSKFSHRNQPSDPASTSSIRSNGIQPLTPLRRQPEFSSPAFISPSSESPPLPLTGSQTNLDGARPRVLQATAESSNSIQRSPSPQRDNARVLWHEDSGVRMPLAEDDIIEFPPRYTPG